MTVLAIICLVVLGILIAAMTAATVYELSDFGWRSGVLFNLIWIVILLTALAFPIVYLSR